MAAQEDEKLKSAVKILIPRIERYRDKELLTEADTKDTIILPLLNALGWAIDDFGQVRREHRRRSNCNPIDYALVVQEEIKLVVEAKSLGENLNRWVRELLGNVSVIGGVKWCVLTDGDTYRVYSATGDGDANEKMFFEVRISDGKGATVEALSLLSRSNMVRDPPAIELAWEQWHVDRRVKTALQEMLAGKDKRLVRLIRRRFPGEHLKPAAIAASLARLEFKDRLAKREEECANTINVMPKDDISKSAGKGGAATFRRLMVEGKPILKAALIEKLMETGISESSANAYIVWAKRTVAGPPDKHRNPFGFCIVESRDESGNKIIARSTRRDGGEPRANP